MTISSCARTFHENITPESPWTFYRQSGNQCHISDRISTLTIKFSDLPRQIFSRVMKVQAAQIGQISHCLSFYECMSDVGTFKVFLYPGARCIKLITTF